MPRFDGTGPQGLGPMTGRGEGYCSMVLPSAGEPRAPYGYAGLRGQPVQIRPGTPSTGTAYPGVTGRVAPGPLRPVFRTSLGRGFGGRRGWRGGRGRR